MNAFSILYDLTKEYAEKWGLDFIDTTPGQNGALQYFRPGLKGFKSTEQMTAAKISILAEARAAIEAAREAGEVDEEEARRQSDGLKASYIEAWQLRHTGHPWVYIASSPEPYSPEPYSLEDRGLVDVTPTTDRDNETEYADSVVQDLAGELNTFDEIEGRLKWARAIWNEYQSAGEGEAVVVRPDKYGDPDSVAHAPRNAWKYAKGSKRYIKAVIFDALF